jgi:hypothetical protein
MDDPALKVGNSRLDSRFAIANSLVGVGVMTFTFVSMCLSYKYLLE